MSFGCTISVHCSKIEHILLYKECQNCVRKLYTNKIIFINDASTILLDFTNFEKIEIIESDYHNRGELLPYYSF